MYNQEVRMEMGGERGGRERRREEEGLGGQRKVVW